MCHSFNKMCMSETDTSSAHHVHHTYPFWALGAARLTKGRTCPPPFPRFGQDDSDPTPAPGIGL